MIFRHFQPPPPDNARDECFCETLDPQAIRLRFLCSEDIIEIQDLCSDWFPISYPKEWYDQIVTPKYYSLVALYEKTIIGLIVCEIKPYHRLNREDRDILPSTFSGCEVGYILSLGVHKKFRRRGIGSLLLDTFLRFITSTDKQNVKGNTIFFVPKNFKLRKNYFSPFSSRPHHQSSSDNFLRETPISLSRISALLLLNQRTITRCIFVRELFEWRPTN